VLDAFTFIFKENEHGLFQVHAYPFDGQTSTFIVECEEDVWRRAEMDQASEAESIAYCEGLFSDFLCSASLMSNRSLWGSFIRVKTQSWRHGNIVLVGDAAHTAHFSIGSGTKLAMDGAISLARSVETAGDLNSALRLYDMDHRPRVDALQAAADESREYFENVKRYTHLEPQQFAFHLLTRSGRIHYDNLRTRDPFYIDSVDRWFQSPRPDQPVRIAPPPMFTPFTLRDMTLENRIAVSGELSSAAQTGASLVITPPIAVTAEGRITPTDAGLYEVKQKCSQRRIGKSRGFAQSCGTAWGYAAARLRDG
jgi:anthraniloyl-CoA monooxygenase